MVNVVIVVIVVTVVKVVKSGQKCLFKLQGTVLLPSNVIMTTPYRVAKVVKVVIKVKVGI